MQNCFKSYEKIKTFGSKQICKSYILNEDTLSIWPQLKWSELYSASFLLPAPQLEVTYKHKNNSQAQLAVSKIALASFSLFCSNLAPMIRPLF